MSLIIVRKDVPASLVGADGQWVNGLQVDGSGRLWVNAGAGLIDINSRPAIVPTSDAIATMPVAGKAITRNAAGTLAVASPVTAAIDFGASGDNTAVAAPGANLALIIYSLAFTVAADVAITFKSGSTAKSGAMLFGTSAGRAPGLQESAIPYGVVVCGTNEAFILNLSGAVAIDGKCSYVTIPTN